MFIMFLIIIIGWAIAGMIYDMQQLPLGNVTKYNTVNNDYKDCSVENEYKGHIEVNNNERRELW